MSDIFTPLAGVCVILTLIETDWPAWDQYHDAMLAERLQHLHPFGWGLCHIDIDRDGLANGSFTLLEFRAVMPDGLVLRIPTTNEATESSFLNPKAIVREG